MKELEIGKRVKIKYPYILNGCEVEIIRFGNEYCTVKDPSGHEFDILIKNLDL